MELDTDKPVDFAWIMIITVAITTVVWLAATFLTKPEPEDTLVAFYRPHQAVDIRLGTDRQTETRM